MLSNGYLLINIIIHRIHLWYIDEIDFFFDFLFTLIIFNWCKFEHDFEVFSLLHPPYNINRALPFAFQVLKEVVSIVFQCDNSLTNCAFILYKIA